MMHESPVEQAGTAGSSRDGMQVAAAVQFPSLKTLMSSADYQAYCRVVRKSGTEGDSPRHKPGLMSKARLLLQNIAEAQALQKQEVLRQAGLVEMHGSLFSQAEANHKEQRETSAENHTSVMNVVAAVKRDLPLSVVSALGGGVVTDSCTPEQAIDTLMARKKQTAVALHAARKLKKEQRELQIEGAREARVAAKAEAKAVGKTKAKSKGKGRLGQGWQISARQSGPGQLELEQR